VGEEKFEWVHGDIVVPPWEWRDHENRLDEDGILFSITDWPSLASIGLYREEKRSLDG